MTTPFIFSTTSTYVPFVRSFTPVLISCNCFSYLLVSNLLFAPSKSAEIFDAAQILCCVLKICYRCFVEGRLLYDDPLATFLLRNFTVIYKFSTYFQPGLGVGRIEFGRVIRVESK